MKNVGAEELDFDYFVHTLQTIKNEHDPTLNWLPKTCRISPNFQEIASTRMT